MYVVEEVKRINVVKERKKYEKRKMCSEVRNNILWEKE